jgi:hypothetical protein
VRVNRNFVTYKKSSEISYLGGQPHDRADIPQITIVCQIGNAPMKMEPELDGQFVIASRKSITHAPGSEQCEVKVGVPSAEDSP